MKPRRLVRTGPLSVAQELLLYIETLTRQAPTISRIAHISGPLDINAFQRAARAVVSSHEALRSIYCWKPAEPISEVIDPEDVPDSCHYLENDDITCANAALARAYDPSNFAAASIPHIRHSIVRISQGSYLWAFAANHIAADAVSLVQYGDTFSRHYAGEEDIRSLTTSIDYALSQRQWFSTDEAQSQLEWWLNRLERMTPFLSPIADCDTGGTGKLRLELRITVRGGRAGIMRRAREWHVPPAALFFAAFSRMIASRNLSRSVLFLTNVPGGGLAGAAAAAGAFYNTLPMEIPAETKSPELAAINAAEALMDVLDHREIPASLINLAAAKLGLIPVAAKIPMTLNITDHPLNRWALPGCQLYDADIGKPGIPLARGGSSILEAKSHDPIGKMDWLITMLPAAVVIAVEFDRAKYKDADVQAMLAEYHLTLAEFIETKPSGDPLELALVSDWRR